MSRFFVTFEEGFSRILFANSSTDGSVLKPEYYHEVPDDVIRYTSVAKEEGVEQDAYGYLFYTVVDARKFLRIASLSDHTANMEEWEIKALAAGWVPPKGRFKK